MGRRQRAAQLPHNLPALQNLIKRDPQSYAADYDRQFRHFLSQCDLLRLHPQHTPDTFLELCLFIAHTAPCYADTEEARVVSNMFLGMLGEDNVDDAYRMPQGWIDTLQDQDLRHTLVTCAMLLRNKNLVATATLLPVLFRLFRCRDKQLRGLLHRHILHDIKTLNQKHKNNKLNRPLQNYMFKLLERAEQSAPDALAAKKAVEICTELYKKKIWDDDKTVQIISDAVFSPIRRISMVAVQFFLQDTVDESDNSGDSANEHKDLKKLQLANKVGGKTKSRKRHIDRALHSMRRKSRLDEVKSAHQQPSFLAIHQIHDPQGFAERLHKHIAVSGNANMPAEVRVIHIRLLARVIGLHRLYLPGYYSLVGKYLFPHQLSVTSILASVAQATHELSSPDDVEIAIRMIANRFVVDTVSNEVISIGLNSIREILLRQPLGLSSPDLVQDLTAYKSHKDKGVVMAARGLLGLFRDIRPEALAKKDRGKEVTAKLKKADPENQLIFGKVKIADGIEGANLLDEDNSDVGDQLSIDSDSDDDDDDDGVSEDELSDKESIENGNDLEEGWEIDYDASDVDNEEEMSNGSESGEESIAPSATSSTRDRQRVELTKATIFTLYFSKVEYSF